MVFQFHQSIFHEIQKNFQPIRLPCKGDRIHSSHRPYRCHCVHSGRVSFHGDKCQTFRQCADVSWIMNDRGFYSDSNVAKRTHAKQTFANLVQISWICSRFVSQRFYDRLVLEIWLHARPFCPKIHSRAVFRDGFSDRDRHKYSSFCTFLRTWMKTNQIERSQLRLQKRKPMAPHQRSSAPEPPTSQHKGSSAWWHRWQSWCLAPKSETWGSKQ